MLSSLERGAASKKAREAIAREGETEVDELESGQIEQIPGTDEGYIAVEAHVKMMLM